MNEFLPKGFVDRERRRAFIPDADFAKRVVAEIRPVNQSAAAVWDSVPSFARPMIAVITCVLLIILGVQVFLPQSPEVGIIDAYLEMDQGPADQWLYRNAELPEGRDLLVEISLAE